MKKGDDIEERLVDFAVAVLGLCQVLPDTAAGRHVAGQMLRSGTSPAPNYGEARGAESRNDFIHKLRIVAKELNETCVWLKIVQRSAMLPAVELTSLQRECRELGRIINASIATAKANRK
jgi:four helix bundle protein